MKLRKFVWFCILGLAFRCAASYVLGAEAMSADSPVAVAEASASEAGQAADDLAEAAPEDAAPDQFAAWTAEDDAAAGEPAPLAEPEPATYKLKFKITDSSGNTWESEVYEVPVGTGRNSEEMTAILGFAFPMDRSNETASPYQYDYRWGYKPDEYTNYQLINQNFVMPAFGVTLENRTYRTSATSPVGGWKVENDVAFYQKEGKTDYYPFVDPHNWDGGSITTAATCTVEGVKTYRCQGHCNQTKTEKIAKLSHVEMDVPGKAATCKVAGYTASKQCKICQTVTQAAEVIPVLAHTWKAGDSRPATCTEDGYSSSNKCEVCGTVQGTGTTTPALGHDYNNTTNICSRCQVVKYALTSGSASNYVLESNANITLTAHAESNADDTSNLILTLDDQKAAKARTTSTLVKGTDYTAAVADYLWKIVLQSSYLEGLEAGTYLLKIDYKGDASVVQNVTLTIASAGATPAPTPTPTPGDSASAGSGGGSGFRYEDTTERQIRAAAKGAVVRLKDVDALSNAAMKALLARKDVALAMEYAYKGKSYSIIIPAGAAVNNDIPWYGPLYLAAVYGNGAGVQNANGAIGGNVYIVKRGDTMSRIARDSNLSLAQLAARNPQIRNIDLILVGQTLNIR